MACYNPQPITRTPTGWRFRGRRPGAWIDSYLETRLVYADLRGYVSCQQCTGCRLERSRQWAVRSVHEAQYHDDNYFLTLTYDDRHVPKNNSLDTKVLQKFWKKLRKAIPDKFKYYAAGEYGENYFRPHYHASMFGLPLPDLYPSFKSSRRFQMYSSPVVEKAWGKGNIYLAPLTFETAAYTARYICKKVLGKDAEAHYKRLGLMPERAWISKGLGKKWHEDYAHETYRDNYIVSRGVPSVPPRTYNRWLKLSDPAAYLNYEMSTKKSLEEQLKLIDDLSSGRHDIARAVKEASLRAGRLDRNR